METQLKPGDIIKGAVWFGRVVDVYLSPTSGETVLEVMFIKNVMMQGQRGDIVRLKDVGNSIRKATLDELKDHANVELSDAILRLDAFLEQPCS